MSMRVKTVQGSVLMAAATIGARPISLVFSIFLLRLLSPDDFGTVALAMILFNTANLFTDVGMTSAIIQTKDDIHKVTFYAFTIANSASLVFYVVVFIFAGPIAQLLGGDESLVPILRLLGIIVVLDGIWTIPEALLRRNLEFKKLAVTKVAIDIVSGATAVALAFMGFGVYSIVIGTIMSETIRVIMYSIQAPKGWLRPYAFEREPIAGLIRFGAPTMLAGIGRYFSQHWDDWMVGRVLGTAALGYYSKAYDMTTRMTFMFSTALFGNVLQPSYAKLQDEPKRLERAYLKSTSLVMLTMVPVSLGLLVLANIIVPVLFGAKWLPMVPVWQIFSIYALTRPISANSSPLFLATGRPNQNLYATILLVVVMVPLVLLVIEPYGIVGVAAVVSITYLIGMIFNMFQVNQMLPGTGLKTLKMVMPFFVAGGVMVLVILLVRDTVIRLAGGANVLSLIILVVIGALTYLSMILVLQRTLIMEMLDLSTEALGLRTRLPASFQRRLAANKNN